MNIGHEYGASISSSQHSAMLRDGMMFGGGGNIMGHGMMDDSRDSGSSRLLL